MLNPIPYTDRVVGDFLRYPLTTYPFADRGLHAQMRRAVVHRGRRIRREPAASLVRRAGGTADACEPRGGRVSDRDFSSSRRAPSALRLDAIPDRPSPPRELRCTGPSGVGVIPGPEAARPNAPVARQGSQSRPSAHETEPASPAQALAAQEVASKPRRQETVTTPRPGLRSSQAAHGMAPRPSRAKAVPESSSRRASAPPPTEPTEPTRLPVPTAASLPDPSPLPSRPAPRSLPPVLPLLRTGRTPFEERFPSTETEASGEGRDSPGATPTCPKNPIARSREPRGGRIARERSLRVDFASTRSLLVDFPSMRRGKEGRL